MNYENHYSALVARGRGRTLDGYKENHHIKPKCLGGDDLKENLVQLTGREHYLAHLLLVKINPGCASLVFAAHMMTIDKHGGRIGNRKYQWLRIRHSKAKSEAMRGKQYGLGTKRTLETRAKMSAALKGGKGRLGQPWSDDQKKILSAASIGKKKSASHAASMIEGARRRVDRLPPYTDGTPRVFGITQRKNGAYVARAIVDGVRKYLGFFWSIESAKDALNAG